MSFRRVMLAWALGTISTVNVAFADAQLGACPDLVSLLIPQLMLHSQSGELPRVEVRRCGPEESLKVFAWVNNAHDPDMIIDITDFTVVQSVMLGRITLIETTGGPRNRLFVVEYDHGHPKLVLMHVSKEQAEIATYHGEIQIKVEDSETGQVKYFRFSTEDDSSPPRSTN